MSKLNLKIVTPEKLVFEGEVEMVNVNTTEGQLGILPGHINLMAELNPGELEIKLGNKNEIFTIGNGFLQVTHSQTTILTDLAVEEHEGKEALNKAQAAKEERLADFEYADTVASLEKTLTSH